MPIRKPTAAGTKASRPMFSAMSREGLKRLQKEAATMTPAAKPVRILRIPMLISPFRKKTQAEPSVVPAKGIMTPMKVLSVKVPAIIILLVWLLL